MRTLDEITRELASIQDELLAADPDDHAALAAIRARQADLREEAARFAGLLESTAPTAALRRELEALRAKLAALKGQRIDLVKQAGAGSGTAPDALPEATLNRRLMAANDAQEIEARVAELERLLTERGEEL